MKDNSPVKNLIGISFRYQKGLLVNRFFSALLFSVLTAIFFFFLGEMAIYIGFSVAIFADFYLTKDRGRLLMTSRGREFASILPLSRFEKFQVLLFDNLMDYFIPGAIITFLAVYGIMPELNRGELIFFYLFSLFHLFFYTAIPREFQIIDKNLMPRNKSLLSFMLILFNVATFTFVGLYFVSGLVVIKLTSNGLNFSLSEKISLVVLFLIMDVILIKRQFFSQEFHPNEHEMIKNRQIFKTAPRPKNVLITLIAMIIFTAGTLLWTRSNVKDNFNAFKFTSFIGLYDSPIYNAYRDDNAEEFTKYFFAENKLKTYKWYSNEFLIKEAIKNQKTKILGALLGPDPTQWDERICAMTKRSPCQKGIFIWLAYQAGENPYYKERFLTVKGDIDTILKVDLMKQSIALCDADFLLVLKESDPKLLRKLIEERKVHIIEHFKKSPNVGDCTDTAFVLFK